MLHALAEGPAALHIQHSCVDNCCEIVAMLFSILNHILVRLSWSLAIVGIRIIGIRTESGHRTDALAQRQTSVDAGAEYKERGPHVQHTVDNGSIIVELIAHRILNFIYRELLIFLFLL